MNAHIPILDRAALCDLDIEQALLGALLNSNAAVDVVEPLVMAADFFEPLHGQIYQTIENARQAGGVVTLQLVIAAMGGFGSGLIADGVTAAQYAARLAAAAVSIREAPAYAKQIREFANRRQILAAAEDMSAGVSNNQLSTDTASAAIAFLDDITARATAGSTPQVSIADADQAALTRMQWGMQNPGKLAGISWGLRELDQKTGGLKRGELFILAGRPGMGKTALAVCVANATARAHEPTLMFSLEMGAVSLADRGLADIAYNRDFPVPYYDIANGTLSDRDAERVIAAAEKRREWPLLVDPAPGLTISQITARARRAQQSLARKGQRLGPIIVDHMHLVAASKRYAGQRVNEVSEISAGLKALAKELDAPVLALAQLSRQVETRDDKRPMMSDLRDSGSIEQDADAIIFVFREAYYLERATGTTAEQEAIRIDKLIDAKSQIEVIVAKQRNGPTGTLKMFCDIGCNAVRDEGF